MISEILQIAGTLTAFCSAYFWFSAANIKVPDTEDWNADDSHPWLTQAARQNRFGAAFAGASALFFGFQSALSMWAR